MLQSTPAITVNSNASSRFSWHISVMEYWSNKRNSLRDRDQLRPRVTEFHNGQRVRTRASSTGDSKKYENGSDSAIRNVNQYKSTTLLYSCPRYSPLTRNLVPWFRTPPLLLSLMSKSIATKPFAIASKKAVNFGSLYKTAFS